MDSSQLPKAVVIDIWLDDQKRVWIGFVDSDQITFNKSIVLENEEVVQLLEFCRTVKRTSRLFAIALTARNFFFSKTLADVCIEKLEARSQGGTA